MTKLFWVAFIYSFVITSVVSATPIRVRGFSESDLTGCINGTGLHTGVRSWLDLQDNDVVSGSGDVRFNNSSVGLIVFDNASGSLVENDLLLTADAFLRRPGEEDLPGSFSLAGEFATEEVPELAGETEGVTWLFMGSGCQLSGASAMSILVPEPSAIVLTVLGLLCCLPQCGRSRSSS